MNNKYINGPINVIRLEGEIFGISKVIYLFFDVHVNLDRQTKCTSLVNTNIYTYFAEEFLKERKTYLDVFFEIGESYLFENIRDTHYAYKDKYIHEVMKLFFKMIDYDKTKKKVIGTKFGENIRFHWIDIRDYFKSKVNVTLSEISASIEKTQINNRITRHDLDILKEKYDQLKTSIDNIKTYFPNNVKRKLSRNKTREENPLHSIKLAKRDVGKHIEKIMTKINSKYHHAEVFEKLSDIYNIIIKIFDNIINDIDFITDYIQDYNDLLATYISTNGLYKLNKLHSDKLFIKDWYGYDPNVYEMNEKISKIKEYHLKLHENILISFSMLVDMYFLRRFLDKDYITNGIVYAGGAHVTQYIYTLVKHFDMKITHVSYSKYDIETVTKKIKEMDIIDPTIEEMFYPPYLQQCVDMGSFPKNFE